jgi:hypothetical protein
MRNLLQYPITKEEVMACIDTVAQRADDDDVSYGNLDAMILMAIATFIDLHSDVVANHLVINVPRHRVMHDDTSTVDM